VGGLAAILFPLMGYYLAFVQLQRADKYEADLLKSVTKQASAGKTGEDLIYDNPRAAWVLYSNQLFMHIYLILYLYMLQRPVLKATFNSMGFILPIYLGVGFFLAIFNFVQLGIEKNKRNTLYGAGWLSTVFLLIACPATIVLSLLLFLMFGKRTDTRVEGEDNISDGESPNTRPSANTTKKDEDGTDKPDDPTLPMPVKEERRRDKEEEEEAEYRPAADENEEEMD